MTAAQRPVTTVGVALSGAQLVALLEDQALTDELDTSGAALVVAGIDRLDGDGLGPATIESTVAAAALAGRTTRVGWLAAGFVQRDHPYNLARRIASTDHLSGGRAGLVLGTRDRYAPPGPAADAAWGGAGLGPGLPLDTETIADAAVAMRALWQSWPADAIVADRATRIYARADRIRRIEHRGRFTILGPLTVPTTSQGSPVLAWRATTPAEVAAADAVADVVLAAPAALTRLPAEAAVLAELTVAAARGEGAAALGDPRVRAVVLRPEPTVDALRELLATTLPALSAEGRLQAPTHPTLRERLRLPAPTPLPADAAPAFAEPVPNP